MPNAEETYTTFIEERIARQFLRQVRVLRKSNRLIDNSASAALQ